MRISAIGLIFTTAQGYAETLSRHVFGVSEGDTITIQIDRQHVRVRINAIDEPGMRQTHGQSGNKAALLSESGE